MNFCMESDEYISLYIDDLLNEEQEEEFLKHVNECSECAQKFKEASFIVQLCRESDDIELPVDFSSSLHKRLVDLDAQETKNRNKLLIFNKKWIAGLSTAAVLFISLLAYNLLPQVGYKSSDTGMAASDRAASQNSSSAFGSSEIENGEKAEAFLDAAQSADANSSSSAAKSAEPSIQITSKENADVSVKSQFQSDPKSNGQDANDTQLAMTFNPKQAIEEDKNNQRATDSIDQPATKIAGGKEESLFTIMGSGLKYYSNYAELSLSVITQRIEIDVLKKLMSELGAVVIPFDVKKDVGITNQEFLDYNMPLTQYYELIHRAVNEYDLKLSAKTDIIQTDITKEYNELNTKKADIDRRIAEAKSKGVDFSDLESAQKELSEKINNILMKNSMISVRIFIYR